MRHESNLNVDYPSWGETIEDEAELLEDTLGEDTLLEINFDEAKDEQMRETAKRIFELDETDNKMLEGDNDFLLMEESEGILDEIFKETQEEKVELNKIMDLTRSKSTGLSLEMVDKLKEAAPGVFETDTKKFNLPQTNSIIIENEKDVVDLMVIMTRHSTPTGTSGPSLKVIEERRQAQFLKEQELEKQRKLRMEKEEMERKARAAKEQERLRREQEELERGSEEVEVLEIISEEEEMEEDDILIDDSGDVLEELQEELVVHPEPILYEEEEKVIPQAIEDEFEEDESSTYSLKELKKKVVISEDTIM